MASTSYIGSSLVNGLSPYTDDPAIFNAVLRDTRQDDQDPIYKELWHACAGPHVNIPSVGEKVFYFPQGHLEQVELNMNQEKSSELPTCNLPNKIPCIVIYVHLEVDEETDEVVAKVTLFPETQAKNLLLLRRILPSPLQERPNITFFSKVLTKSDISKKSVSLRRDTEQLFPPLDMTMKNPAQDLVAKDLCGREWYFRHTYRGSEKRHVLSTGWNTFVYAKNIEPGDALIFIRSENGEYHVGVRHSKKLWRNSDVSVLASANMQFGLLSTAYHAIRTESMFSVYYRPKSCPAEFLIPYAQYEMSLERNISVGTMCTIKSESDEFPEKRSTGTIVGIEYIDQVRWPGSLWRCLKIQRHGLIGIVQPERISPWKVVPLEITDNCLDLSPDLIKEHHQAKRSLAASVNLGLSLQDFILAFVAPYQEYSEILQYRGVQNREYRVEEEQSFSQWISLRNSDSTKPERKMPEICFPCDQNKDTLKTCTIFGVIIQNQVQVHKYGNVIPREIDIARLNGYEELYSTIDQMFNFRGGLKKKCYWCMMYKDDEGQYTSVGDSSWTVFCSTAQKLFICPKEEIQKLRVSSHLGAQMGLHGSSQSHIPSTSQSL